MLTFGVLFQRKENTMGKCMLVGSIQFEQELSY